jgi:di/tricarboxylate transporter
MEFKVLWTIVVIAGMFSALVRNAGSPDFVMLAALSLLLFAGVITASEALAGFSNEGMLTVAFLFVLSEAIRNTGALNTPVYRFLGEGKNRTLPVLLLKMMVPIAGLSAFLNNTAIVAIFMPTIKKWTENLKLPPSKFFIPLSFATVLGGCITLIGTSTNLIVHGLMLDNKMNGFAFFELAWVGIPCTIAGILYLIFIGARLLPDRKDVLGQVSENSREYVVEMLVRPDSPLIGKSVGQAALRNLRGLFLVDIERNGQTLGTVSRKEILQPKDRLVFAGVTSAVVDLQRLPGLVPTAAGTFAKDFRSMRTHLVEAVLSPTSPVLGKTVKESGFRSLYDAGIVAVHRHGERIQQKIGDIELRAGDTLLLFAQENFVQHWRESQDFFLISYLGDKLPAMTWQGTVLLAVTVLMVVGAVLGEMGVLSFGGNALGILEMAIAAVLISFFIKAIRGRDARRALRLDVLITIACSFGISKALQKTGIAAFIAESIVGSLDSFGPQAVLAGLYLVTNLFTEIMSNNAAAVLIFPIALAIAEKMGINPMPFIVAITMAASYGFSTPIGYQTHLMVQGAGGYKFSDYFRVGILLNLICFVISVLVIPIFWKF